MNPDRFSFSHALHLLVLAGFAVAQPLYDLLGRNPEFFVARHAPALDVGIFVLVLSFLGPVILVTVVFGMHRISLRLGQWAHGLCVAVLVGLFTLPALKRFGGGVAASAVLVGAALIGTASAWADATWRPIRLFLSLLSPAILLFPGVFLLSPGIAKVMRGQDATPVVPTQSPFHSTTPIVLVIFDEFAVTSLMNQEREIDPALFPNFAALAKEFTWFRNATAVADNTPYAIPSILTGTYPNPSKLPILADHPNNLFTWLNGSYDFHAIESITELCPVPLCLPPHPKPLHRRIRSLFKDAALVYAHMVLPDPFLRRLPAVTQTWGNFTKDTQKGRFDLQTKARDAQEDIPGIFETFLAGIRSPQSKPPSGKPGLYFLHIMVPHYPWIYLPSGQEYRATRNIHYFDKEKWVSDTTRVEQGFQRYLLQVGYVDLLLGKLIVALKAAGLYDQALVVITSDHGVSIRPDDARRPLTDTNHADILSVPLLIKTPHQRQGAISDRAVETIDILPTIADILGVSLPWPVDGRSALDLSIPERKEVVIYWDQARKRNGYDPHSDAKYATLDRKLSLFGSGTGLDGLFEIGTDVDWIGHSVDTLPQAKASDVHVRLDDLDAYRAVDPESGFVPAQITGKLFPVRQEMAPYSLAVAINGIVYATTQTFQEGNQTLFSAIVPEHAFYPGKNQVDVFVISRTNQGARQITRLETQ